MAVAVPISGTNVDIEYIDKYKIVGILGSGGCNYVLDAVETRTQTPCAVKVLFGFGRDPDEYIRGIARLANEGKAFKEAGFHERILRFLGSGDLKIEPVAGDRQIKIPCYFNVFEKVDLYCIPRGKGFPVGFSPQQVAKIGAEAASALIQFHNAGWVHRDVKPENLFIDKERHVHLGDLGIAYKMNRRVGADGNVKFVPGRPETMWGGMQLLNPKGCLAGTIGLMSPEQARDPYENVGPESDIYSLGVSLYVMASGKHPFEESDAISVLMKVVHEKAVPLKECMRLPRRLSDIVEKMMQKEPENRGDLRQLEIDLRKVSTEHSEFSRVWRNSWKF